MVDGIIYYLGLAFFEEIRGLNDERMCLLIETRRFMTTNKS